MVVCAEIRLATIEKIAKVLHVHIWDILQPGKFPEPERQRGKSIRRIAR